MNKWILSVCMLALSGIGYAGYPVLTTTKLPYRALLDAGTLLQQAPPFNGVNPAKVQLSKGNDTASAVTCNQYLSYRSKGYEPSNNAELAIASHFIDYCIPLQELTQTKAAKISNLRNFDLWSDYQLLPASLLMPALSGKGGPKGTFINAYPNATLKTMGANNIQLTNGSQIVNVSVLAWGDYTGDGFDDMMLSVSHFVQGGTYHAYDIVWVTRTTPKGRITVVKSPSDKSASAT